MLAGVPISVMVRSVAARVGDVVLTSADISGVTGNSTAAAGMVGEEISSVVAVGSAVSLTTATVANVTSISLTAGDWQVDGVVDFHPGAITTSTYFQQGVSTTSATLGAQDTYSSDPLAIVTGGAIDFASPVPLVRLHLSGTTTVYLVAKAGFAISTMTAYGTIHATRLR